MCKQKERRVLCITTMLIVVVLVGMLSYHGVKQSRAASSMSVEQVEKYVNEIRAGQSKSKLRKSSVLAAVAQEKANRMAQRGEFQHTLSDGTTAWQLLQDAGYRYRYAGENLAVHFTDEVSMVDAWYASKPHRELMLSERYTEFAVAMSVGEYQGYTGTFVVLLFGATIDPLRSL